MSYLLRLYSEILTSSSLLHPTRLSKIFARLPRAFAYADPRRASKLASAASSLYRHLLPETCRTLKRTKQEGRIPPHAVARTEFCYHSLQRISSLFITPSHPWWQTRRFSSRRSSISWGDSFRIPGTWGLCKGSLKKYFRFVSHLLPPPATSFKSLRYESRFLVRKRPRGKKSSPLPARRLH